MRQEAMLWWGELDNKNKVKYCPIFFKGRNHYSLTGREIEIIFKRIS
jgi:hypothetical protein